MPGISKSYESLFGGEGWGGNISLNFHMYVHERQKVARILKCNR